MRWTQQPAREHPAQAQVSHQDSLSPAAELGAPIRSMRACPWAIRPEQRAIAVRRSRVGSHWQHARRALEKRGGNGDAQRVCGENRVYRILLRHRRLRRATHARAGRGRATLAVAVFARARVSVNTRAAHGRRRSRAAARGRGDIGVAAARGIGHRRRTVRRRAARRARAGDRGDLAAAQRQPEGKKSRDDGPTRSHVRREYAT